MHTSLIIFWSGSIALFELSHFVEEKPLYEQGYVQELFICDPLNLLSCLICVAVNLGTLGFSIGRGGEIRSIYSYFLSSALHLICSAFLSLGGIYHAIFGREVLDETTDAHIKLES